MPRYIDADWIVQKLDGWREQLAETYGENDEYVLCLGEVLMKIDDTPTADVVERKTGKWNTDKESPEYATCSVCGHCDWDCTESEYFNYCPNCGARMEGEADVKR